MRNILKRWQPVTNYSAAFHLEGFFVASIASILGIRLFLELTGYPQIGSENLHIAHVLWGGLMMLIAVVILINFLGDRPRGIAAILGGIGFGFFIDELGKFITKDNNYFFKPTALLLYVFFILLWLLFRRLDTRRTTSHKAQRANTLDILNEGLIFGFNPKEKIELNKLLKHLDSKNSLDNAILNLSKEIVHHAKADEPNWYIKLTDFADKIYGHFVRWKYLPGALFIVFLILGILSTYNLFQVGFDSIAGLDEQSTYTFIGQMIGGLLYSFFVLLGLYQLRNNRKDAYKSFKKALLVNIFITQLFAFYHLQFWAVFGLALNLLLLASINYLLQLERHHTGKN